MTNHVDFTVVLRGYHKAAVDAVVARTEQALASNDPALRAAVRNELGNVNFDLRLRGYDRPQVDDYLARAAAELG